MLSARCGTRRAGKAHQYTDDHQCLHQCRYAFFLSFQDAIGQLQWQFKVEELPVDPDDPKPPQTGDDLLSKLLAVATVGALAVVVVLLILKKDKKQEA